MKEKKKKEEKTINIESIIKEKEELNDKLLRTAAEMQNYKKRKDEEISKIIKYSNEEMILEFLPIIDNFERAIRLDDENLNDELSKFLEGFKMIYSNMFNVLKNYEVEEIEALGKEFDSNYHEAVLTDCVEEKEDNIILEVLQKGYKYKDKIIRHSLVKVNRKGEMKNE
ncbi:MAG: nucleotide exchange factor GrpE [Bacilli bacterium]|nr:nucleotide exchange factor GrpE [Bacilli bacterium]